jgi:hypothetical protein
MTPFRNMRLSQSRELAIPDKTGLANVGCACQKLTGNGKRMTGANIASA